VLVPHYNGRLSGKVGRIRLSLPYHDVSHNFTDDDVQALDLTCSENVRVPQVLRGFTGGFTAPTRNYWTLTQLGIFEVL
jgi:hypothetical protein